MLKLISFIIVNLCTLLLLYILMIDIEDNYNMDILKYIQEKPFPWKLVPIAWILWFIVNGWFVYKFIRKIAERNSE